MSITTALIATFFTLFCVAAAAMLLRLLYVAAGIAKQAETETLPMEPNRETSARRRARAGAPSHASLPNFPAFTALSATRIRFPSE